MPDRIGQQISDYRLIQLLGAGGFAEVYLGQHTLLRNMQVAVKVLHEKLGRNNRDGFFQEAETIVALKHPHIIRLLGFGVEGDTHNPYLIMDYAPQGTLRSKYPKGSMLPLATVSGYVKQIAQALQYAHDRHRIHCDLKPENFLIGENGEILLSDFGIAVIAQNTEQMQTNPYVGTLPYSAPEQINGKPRRESDQYALAIIVYEWLSGKRPFNGTLPQIMSQHLNATPPPFRAVPSEVEEVVMKALAKNPKDRFGSMQEFAESLEQAYLTTISSTVVRGPLPGQQPNIKDKKTPPDQPSQGSQKDDRVIQQSSQSTDMRTPRITQDVSVSSQIGASNTSSGRETEHPSMHQPSLQQGSPLTADEPMKKKISRRKVIGGIIVTGAVAAGGGFYYLTRTLPISTALYIYRGHSENVYSVAWSPDGKSITSASKDKTVQVWDATTGTLRLTYRGHSSEVFSVAWSPDGKLIASGSVDETVQVWQAI